MKIKWGKFLTRRLPIWLWSIIIVAVIIRLMLPPIGLRVINWALANKLGEYDGSIQDFDLSLYRGAYQLQKLVIKKKGSNLDPILSADEIDLSIAWRTLLQKKISSDIQVNRLVVRLMDSDKKEKKQLGTEETGWQQALDVIVPISVESIKIKNSGFYFVNNDLKVPVPVKIEQIQGRAEDLQSRHNKDSDSLSPFWIDGILQEHSALKLTGKIDALAKLPRFDLDFSLVDFHPKSVNPILLNYLPLDLTSGELSIYGEAATTKGNVKGYINLFLKDVDVVAPDQKLLSVKHFFVEIVSAFANWILQSKEQKIVAAHIPFSRIGKKFEIGYAEGFKSALANKKSELKKGFDKSISLKNLEDIEESPVSTIK